MMRGYADTKNRFYPQRTQSLAMDYSPIIFESLSILLSNAFNRCKPNDTMVLPLVATSAGEMHFTLSDTGESIPRKSCRICSVLCPTNRTKPKIRDTMELFFAKQLIEKFNGHRGEKRSSQGNRFYRYSSVTHRCACERKV